RAIILGIWSVHISFFLSPLIVTCSAIGRRVILRFAMAVHTPTHGEWSNLFDHRHLLHRPVTILTNLAGLYVWSVVELHVLRQHVNASPLNRCIFLESVHQFFDMRTFFAVHRTHGEMAVHTHIERRHRSKTGGLGRRVTVFTVNAQSP